MRSSIRLTICKKLRRERRRTIAAARSPSSPGLFYSRFPLGEGDGGSRVKAVAAHTKASLARYRGKRDFNQTVEPSGEVPVQPSQRGRFVIQKHAATRLHYDLRLELDGVFKSWAVTKGPSVDPADKRLAVEVEDHPLDYGDFEGTIPKGQYGGGTVQLWDRGYWSPVGPKTPEQGLQKGDFKFTLDGNRLHGDWVLVRLKKRSHRRQAQQLAADQA